MSVTTKIEYTGNLHCEMEHGPSKTRLETDAPKDNMGKGEAFSPTDLVGAALASCAVTTMAIKAPKEGIPFTAAKGMVTKEMSSEGPRRIVQLALDYVTRHRLTASPCRFDVVSIHLEAGEPVIEVYENAFDATGR